MIKRGYGYVPDLPDRRDFVYGVSGNPLALPVSVDLRTQCSPIEDQAQTNSCVGHAAAGALQFLELKDGVPYTDLSRLFPYWGAREMEGTTQSDGGCQPRDAIKFLASTGIPPESLWPFDATALFTKPSDAAYTAAASHKIVGYSRVIGLQGIRQCLASGYPVLFGFTVYDSFEGPEIAATGTMSMPTSDESVVGGHCVVAVGYQDSTQQLLVRNSWGTEWGMAGYFWMPYSYLTPDLTDDYWTLRKAAAL